MYNEEERCQMELARTLLVLSFQIYAHSTYHHDYDVLIL